MPHDEPTLWKLVLELWNTGKPELAPEVYAASAEYRQPGREPIHGAQAIAEWIAAVHRAFPDFHMEITRTLTDDASQYVLGWVCTGTHRGEFMGVPATGRHVEVHGVTVGRLSHGRIHEETVYYDRLGFLEQVGAQIGAAPGPAHEVAALR